jgi:hypothetical protein
VTSTAQSFLLFLIVLGAAATTLRLVSRTSPTVPYPVLLLHASGVVSVVVGGIVVSRNSSQSGRLKGTQLTGFWNLLAFVLNAMLFLMVAAWS